MAKVEITGGTIMYSGGSAGRGKNHFLSLNRTVTAVVQLRELVLVKVASTGGTKTNSPDLCAVSDRLYEFDQIIYGDGFNVFNG